MKKAKELAKRIVGAVAVNSAKIACGTASANNFGQPKEPKNLKSYFKK